MMNCEKKKEIRKTTVKGVEKAFISIAEIFSTLGCCGRVHEPKMPEKLKK